MNGRIVQWNDAVGIGRISGDRNVAVRRQNCSSRLQARLAGHAIPPGAPVAVTFDVDPLGNEAINVDLAGTESFTGAAMAMTSMGTSAPSPPRVARKAAARKSARKKGARKKTARASAATSAKRRRSGKKPAGKAKRAGKRPTRRKPRKRR
jgi:hypothetical protein